MSKYYELILAMWMKHAEEPLSANEVALYSFLLHKAMDAEWKMPIRVHSAELCHSLFGSKSVLERTRKKLKEKGLIDFTASRSPRYVPTYSILGCCEESDKQEQTEKNVRIMVDAIERMWELSDERCLNASEIAVYLFLLSLAEPQNWKMPVRCMDYVLLALVVRKKVLANVLKELAERKLLCIQDGDGIRDIPRYTIPIHRIIRPNKESSRKEKACDRKHIINNLLTPQPIVHCDKSRGTDAAYNSLNEYDADF